MDYETIKKLCDKINTSNKSKEVYQIIKRLQALKNNGASDKEITDVLNIMELPLGLHLFITGNFSNLMKINIR